MTKNKKLHTTSFSTHNADFVSDESQNTEFKTSWRGDYLKWIRGFANARFVSLIGAQLSRRRVRRV